MSSVIYGVNFSMDPQQISISATNVVEYEKRQQERLHSEIDCTHDDRFFLNASQLKVLGNSLFAEGRQLERVGLTVP